ncbi:MAG: hypothetical protein A2X86_09195 [Bdellovibrionales bacterium GWA2_49_15]|nr:MAG: hypothetical protein A2X86_09195 [Bdellovibrionales bacterium GWA2_49_15]HAZ12953.1 hypothetical protein [Bdellovibrionales bacterium]
MSQINWANLRSWNGSQQGGFEELCCQLAHYEPIADKKKFLKKGAPDAGVECFWLLQNGTEIAWQAKFFLAPPTPNQWCQINESVETALTKHPNLIGYIVCLPIDRADARVSNQKSFLDRWNEKTAEWEKLATSKGMNVKFDFWGNYEIGERLSREDHCGRNAFWFNKLDLSYEWFKKRLKESIADAGPRYSPKVNIALPISFNYKAQSLSKEYFAELLKIFGKYLENIKSCIHEYSKHLSNSEINFVKGIEGQIVNWLNDLKNFTKIAIEFNEVLHLIDTLNDFVDKEFDSVHYKAEKFDESENKKKKEKYSNQSNNAEIIKNVRDRVSSSSYDFKLFLKADKSKLVNHPFSLLVGNAGNGKTHLFSDIAGHILDAGTPAILILGEKLSLGNPWKQILETLNLSCTRDEFLGAFQSAAQASNSRGLIFIDALNESENKTHWAKHIPGMISAISHYPNIGLALSVRTSYEDLVVPSHIQNNLVRLVHDGFGSQLTKAVQVYFTYHNISLPSVPLLSPEFNNPLFLGVFCRTLQNMGQTEIPDGMSGFFDIFKEFLNSINDHLSQPGHLDYDRADNLVFKFIDRYCTKLSTTGATWMPVDRAREIAKSIYPSESGTKSLYRHLLSEGLISEDRFYADGNWEEGVRFSYERFCDHFTASKIISSNPEQRDLNAEIKGLFPDLNACYMKRGLLDAFSIQYPETYGTELINEVPEISSFDPVRESLLESLLWRSTESVTVETAKQVAAIANSTEHFTESFTDTLTYLAPKENHRFNAFYLDRNLKRLKMPDRDSWWSIYIHKVYDDDSPLGRAINWILEMDDQSNLALRIAPRLQLAVLLSWCFTTPNRQLRDKATKATVRLLENHLNTAEKLFKNFIDVNDLYVLERVLASCMGATTRSRDLSGLDALALSVFESIFRSGEPPVHLVLRDYARTICEFAFLKNPDIKITKNLIRPPYKSEWPSHIPSANTVESKYGQWHDKMTEEEYGMHAIYTSVMGFGDFARYIIGTNSHSFDWKSTRLYEKQKPTGKEILETFVNSLNEKQCKNWKLLKTINRNISYMASEREAKGPSEKELINLRKATEKNFLNSLGSKKRAIYKSQIIPYIKNPNALKYSDNFDLNQAQRFVINRVFELGWTKEKFGLFDRNIHRYDHTRTASKNERMGKKYQWLAWFEFLARVSDNFIFSGDDGDPKSKTYEGPWQLSYSRDIDPSLLISKSNRDQYKTSTSNWWNTVTFDKWEAKDNLEWLQSETILPTFEDLILVKDQWNKQWIALDAFPEWYEPLSPELERYQTPQKRIWFMLKSYIMKKSDVNKFIRWGEKQDFMGSWMPESHAVHNVFWGEHFWAPAYEYINQPYYNRPGWSEGSRGRVPVAILSTCEQYMRESSGYDRSIDETVHFNILNSWIAKQLALEHFSEESKLYNKNGELYAFDPSVFNSGSASLLADAKILEDLDSIGYGIVWTWLGEKDILSNEGRKWEGRLEISGISYFEEGTLKTAKNFKFKGPGSDS